MSAHLSTDKWAKPAPDPLPKRRLCIVVPTHWEAFMGGAQYQAKWIVEEAARTNLFEIYYLSRRIREGVKPIDHHIVRIGGAKWLRRFGLLFDARSLWKRLDEIRPEVIYQRVGGAYTGVCASYAARRGARMIWHIAHDDDVTPGAGGGRWRKPHRLMEKKLLEYGIRKADAVIAQTRYQARLLRKNYGIEAAAVIPNAHPYPRERVSKGTPVKVVWVANWKPEKRPELFIKLAEDLSHRTDARFYMAGSLGSTNQDYSSLVNRAKHLTNLEYLGGISQEQVNALLAEADVFVNTSRGEGFANTFIQAWLRGVPVVSLSVNPDGLLGETGLGFCSGDYRTLRDDVFKLVTDESIRTRMGRYCTEYATESHSLRNVRQIIELM